MEVSGLKILFTCEHASAAIPAPHRHLFRGQNHHLKTHWGWDFGAEPVARQMSQALRAPLISGTYSRLFVDLNRSEGHPKVFSKFTRELLRVERMKILEQHHRPHWQKVQDWIARQIQNGNRVLHIGVHSFTPVYEGYERQVDLALLYDPQRALEAKLCREWQLRLRAQSPLRIRRNTPYRGTMDGLTTQLRRRFSKHQYLGIEIEMNHDRLATRSAQKSLAKLLIETAPQASRRRK